MIFKKKSSVKKNGNASRFPNIHAAIHIMKKTGNDEFIGFHKCIALKDILKRFNWYLVFAI